ncbi:radical SAM protein [Ruminococcus sp. AM46-18]|nr:radical SAM protein [Ruminococcus sp. AM46-18]
MSDNKVYMFVPPAHDWGMPLIALPLLKTYVKQNIECKIIDINVDFFNYIWGKDYLDSLKYSIKKSFNDNDMMASVDKSVDLEKKILFKRLNDKEYVLSRKIHTIDEWYSSQKVYEFLESESETEKILSLLLDNYYLDDGNVFAISIGVEDQIVPSFIIMKLLKRKFKHTPIILGGNIISRLADNLSASKLKNYFDILIVGEGEKSLPFVLENILNKQNFEDFNSIVRCDEKELPFDRRWCENTPDFEDITWDSYLCPVAVLPITLNRKCDWGKCDFCAIHVCWTPEHRERDLNEVITEICYYIEKYNIKFFRIVDENVSAKLLDKFSDMILEKNISIYYEMYTRFDKKFLDYQFAKKIYNSGCRQIFWGIENIDDDALKFMNKGTNQNIINATLENTAKAGILNYCFILTGVPHISIETEKKTIEYIIQNKNIHVAAIGSYVVDKLSPMEVDDIIRSKYHISLYDIGDLTTEIGYLYEGCNQNKKVKLRTIDYIKDIYSKRPDYALSSLLNEEIRFVLTQKYGNQFIAEYISGLSEKELAVIEKEAMGRVVEERVLRNSEV